MEKMCVHKKQKVKFKSDSHCSRDMGHGIIGDFFDFTYFHGVYQQY